MEVYTGVFSADGEQLRPTVSSIVGPGSFDDILAEGPVLFIGDGAMKCRDVLGGDNAHFVQCWPKAASMLRPAAKALKEGTFEDTAYFEPFYLKEFLTTTSKKKLF
mgnify:CR=1 FL=1